MTSHSTLSPSSRHRWQLCPASVAACAQYASGGTSSKSAIDGTHTHTLLEHCLKNNLDASQVLGLTLTDHEGEFTVDFDRANRVQVALDYVRKTASQYTSEYEVAVITESRVDPAPLVGRSDMSGTVDVQIVTTDTLEIIDYKDGVMLVDAKDNPQLQQYAFGAIAAKKDTPFQKIKMTIVQPKLALKGLPPITSHEYTMDAFMENLSALQQEAAATDEPDAPFVPGDSQCGFCDHKGNCGSFNQWVLEKSGIKFENMEYVKEAAQSDPGNMSDDKLRELVEAAPLLRKMIEAAEEEALRRITAGHTIEGLKVVRGSGRRGWALPEAELAEKLKKMGLPKDVIWRQTLISPAQVEKARWEKRDGTVKQLTEKQLEVVASQYQTKSDGKLTVVPDSDHRKAQSFTDLGTMFAAVPEVQPQPSWLS